MKRVGYVTVFGRANAGKSTLINAILGFNLLPVSDKPQTTRDNVRAIYNDDESQVIFLDTPGIFKPHGKLGSILIKTAKSALEGTDIILYVVAADEVPSFDQIELLESLNLPIVLAYNKIDKVNIQIGEDRLSRYLEHFTREVPVVKMSAIDGYGVSDLISLLKDMLPEGEEEYDTDIVSDRPKEYIISEMIREKCLESLSEEIPHSIYVDVRQASEIDGVLEVIGDIIVEKDSAKAIVIGKRGQMIAKISKNAEKKISSYFGTPVTVNLHVKTIKDWRNDDRYLRRFGFED